MGSTVQVPNVRQDGQLPSDPCDICMLSDGSSEGFVASLQDGIYLGGWLESDLQAGGLLSGPLEEIKYTCSAEVLWKLQPDHEICAF